MIRRQDFAALAARRSGRLEVDVAGGSFVAALSLWFIGPMDPVLTDMSMEARAPEAKASPEVDALARGLAGLDEAPKLQRARPGYARRVARSFARFEAKVGAPLQAWSAEALPQEPGETVFYPFAGADFPTAHRMYPRATRYVLVAMQRGGPPPALDRLSAEELGAALATYEELLRGFLGRGFFITQEMNEGTDDETAVRGITGLLMIFAAREGFTVEGVEPIALGDDGAVADHPGDPARSRTWDSVRLRLRRADGTPASLEYLRVGLSNMSVRPESAAHTLVAGLAGQRVILKAASHLPQDPNFSGITGLLLAHAPTIVQDETGVAYDALRARFQVALYGDFAQANLLFEEAGQSSLLAAYREARAPKLPFHVGYRKGARACMLVATRAGAQAP